MGLHVWGLSWWCHGLPEGALHPVLEFAHRVFHLGGDLGLVLA